MAEERTDNDGSEFQRPEHYIRYIGIVASRLKEALNSRRC